MHLKAGVFPDDQIALENKIRSLRAQGNSVTAEDIDTVEKMGDKTELETLDRSARRATGDHKVE